MWQLLKPVPTREATAMGSPHTPQLESSPRSSTAREKACAGKKTSTVKNAQLNKKYLKRLGKGARVAPSRAYPSSP